MVQLLPIAFAAAASGTFLWGLAMSGVSLYCIIALGYFISGATECYDKDKSIGEVFKSRFTPESGVSFTFIIKAIGTCLWSPFFLLGGLCGMGVKAIAKLISGSKKNPETSPASHPLLSDGCTNKSSSYSTLIPSLGHSILQPTNLSNPECPIPNTATANPKLSPSQKRRDIQNTLC